MKRVAKIILYIFFGLVLLLVLWWVGSAAYSGWTGYKWEKQTEKFQMALSKPYREDIYGGKTPEETWAMFLEALKKEDVELASKYVVPEKRSEELEFLKQEKLSNNLSVLKVQLSGVLEKDKVDFVQSDSAHYHVIFLDENKLPRSHSVVFILNPYTKVWKISLL